MGTIRTHWYADDLLKQCPSKGDKYVIDEKQTLKFEITILLNANCNDTIEKTKILTNLSLFSN